MPACLMEVARSVRAIVLDGLSSATSGLSVWSTAFAAAFRLPEKGHELL
jgi:hypothetical protein